MARLGSAKSSHRKRAGAAADRMISNAQSVVESAEQGNCTGAFESLALANHWDGRSVSENVGAGSSVKRREAVGALIDARNAFRRHCMKRH